MCVRGGVRGVYVRSEGDRIYECLEGILFDEMPKGPWAPGYIYGRGANEVVDNDVPEADSV